jgi:hypothetical protein
MKNNKNLDYFKNDLEKDIKESLLNTQTSSSLKSKKSYMEKFNEIMRKKSYTTKSDYSYNSQIPIHKK